MKFDEQLLVEHVVWAESEELQMYKDSVGIWTIGVGHNIQDKGISKAVSRLMLKEDLAEVYADVARLDYFDGLNPARQMVIVDMVFNLGFSRFLKFVKFNAALRLPDYSLAAHEMGDSKWYRQTGRRAEKLQRIMLSGVWE